MRRIILVGVVVLAGCADIVGPFKRAQQRPEKVDNPCLTIPEQEKKGRERLALPESARVAPSLQSEPPP
jgi:hypothetical protein